VLVAEDHPINELLVTELLRSRGHFFAVARNGLEVLHMMERQAFDAILMDGQMPEMDGYQATAEIRRRERTSGTHIHIVAVTAHAMKDDREVCIAAGMDDYIAKPIEPEQLFATLEKPWATPAAQKEGAGAGEGADQPAAPLVVFDVEAALTRTRGKKTLLLKMASAFVADVPRALEELRSVAASADPAAIERSAHRMKGAAATLSGDAVVHAAVKVERLARAEPVQPAPMQAAVSELAECVNALSQALSNFLSEELP
jgi:CheY-like chemotaxis protein